MPLNVVLRLVTTFVPIPSRSSTRITNFQRLLQLWLSNSNLLLYAITLQHLSVLECRVGEWRGKSKWNDLFSRYWYWSFIHSFHTGSPHLPFACLPSIFPVSAIASNRFFLLNMCLKTKCAYDRFHEITFCICPCQYFLGDILPGHSLCIKCLNLLHGLFLHWNKPN